MQKNMDLMQNSTNHFELMQKKRLLVNGYIPDYVICFAPHGSETTQETESIARPDQHSPTDPRGGGRRQRYRKLS